MFYVRAKHCSAGLSEVKLSVKKQATTSVMRYPSISAAMLELLIEEGVLPSASLLQPKAEQGRVQTVCHLKGVASKHMEKNHKCLLLSHKEHCSGYFISY